MAALDEQETNFTIEATDRKTVHIFTNGNVWIGRLEKLGLVAHNQDEHGKFFKVDLNEYSFGVRKKRILTEEQKQVLAERMAAIREA